MRIPSKITAGDAPSWTDVPLTLADGTNIGPATHTLAYSFRGPVQTANIDISSTVSGGGWLASLSAIQTAAFNTGNVPSVWYWQAYATEIATSKRTTVGDGQLTVKPNLAGLTTSVFDGRTQNERDLAAVKAAISARVSGGMVLDYTIGSRNLKKEPVTALLALESRLKILVAREKNAQALANGLGNPGKSFVRFTSR